MAIIALSTADTVDFVSLSDPDAITKEIPKDLKDPTQGSTKVVESWAVGATVFKLRALDVYLMGHIYDNASSLTGKQGTTEVGIHTKVNQTNIDAVRFSLVSMPSNFLDKKGQPVRFKTKKAVVNGREYDVADEGVLNSLGLRLIAEMADKVREISEVAEPEIKNSEEA